jgi:Proprotein convertase P-domain
MGSKIAKWVLLSFFLVRSWVFAVIEPTVVPQGSELDDPLYYTGAIETDVPYGNGTSWISVASGAVAGHPRMVLSCAHLNYEKKVGWFGVGSTRWFLQWNRSGKPSIVGASGLTLSGFYRFDGYATLKEADPKEGKSSAQTFAKDYVVHYHVSQNTANGYFAPLLEAGADFLLSASTAKTSFIKKISGYPSDQYQSGDPSNYRYRMHETVPFANKATQSYGPYMEISGVTIYGGNSGGPIWGWVKGRWAHTGVVVSHDDAQTMAGVVANHPEGMSLIFSALQDQFPDSPVFRNTVAVSGVGAIPDAGNLSKTFTVANMLGSIQMIKLNLNIQHPRRGDLVITLRSPQNKTVTVLQSVPITNSSPKNLVASLNVLGFGGITPNGTWTLTIKDVYRTRTGTLVAAGMDITTR